MSEMIVYICLFVSNIVVEVWSTSSYTTKLSHYFGVDPVVDINLNDGFIFC